MTSKAYRKWCLMLWQFQAIVSALFAQLHFQYIHCTRKDSKCMQRESIFASSIGTPCACNQNENRVASMLVFIHCVQNFLARECEKEIETEIEKKKLSKMSYPKRTGRKTHTHSNSFEMPKQEEHKGQS